MQSQIEVKDITIDSTHVPVYAFIMDTKQEYSSYLHDKLKKDMPFLTPDDIKNLVEKTQSVQKDDALSKVEQIGILAIKDTATDTLTAYVAARNLVAGAIHGKHIQQVEVASTVDGKIEAYQNCRLNALRCMRLPEWKGERMPAIEIEATTTVEAFKALKAKGIYDTFMALFNVKDEAKEKATRDAVLKDLSKKYGKKNIDALISKKATA